MMRMTYIQDARAAVEAAQKRDDDTGDELTYKQLTEHPVTQLLEQVAKSGVAPYKDDIEDLRLPKRARAKLVEAIHEVMTVRNGETQETSRQRGGERSTRKDVVTSRTHPTILAKQAARNAAEDIVPRLPLQHETRQANEKRVSEKDRTGRAVVDQMKQEGRI